MNVLSHELIHAWIKTYICNCEGKCKKINWLIENSGITGHGDLFQYIAYTIESDCLSALDLPLDLYRSRYLAYELFASTQMDMLNTTTLQ